MELFSNPYIVIIALCLIIIISFFFSALAKKTNIPSVLMLILLGIIIGQFITSVDIEIGEESGFALELLGIVGLIMIVLEAALDLQIRKEKQMLIIKSFSSALLSLLLTAAAITFLFYTFNIDELNSSIMYAIPLSVISSAILIPSVANLVEKKREFMVYEGTFSDILGIMLFYFILEGFEIDSALAITGYITINVTVTLILSLVLSYLMIIIFQRMGDNVKFFMLFSVLILLYSVEKLFHLSSLITILVFGIMIVNHRFFFKGWLKKYINEPQLETIKEDLHIITIESSFVVRTLFFVVFGITIDLGSLFSAETLFLGIAATIIIYIIRFIGLKISGIKPVSPELFLAPRGLITILLFAAIPAGLTIDAFDPGIMLYVIIFTNVIMAYGLIVKGKEIRSNEGEMDQHTPIKLEEPVAEQDQSRM